MEDLFFFATLLDSPTKPAFRITAPKVLFSDDAPRTPNLHIAPHGSGLTAFGSVAAEVLPPT